MKVKYNPNDQILIILPKTVPDWEEFISFGRSILQSANINEINTEEIGADRHRITFTFEQNRFSLNYENYSNSIWIESDEPSATEYLDKLATHLSN